MTKIPLRLYVQEIEEAINEKQIEEAIAHCRHVLKSYPKHIDTYRLLGKAFLESQRYVNAADIFQRVLSTVPNDFVSHIGMSIIREDEGNLDASIWHMERAFESQPYNTAIQGELRRLYGLRDGMEPPKIRMTKGALAQMYAKSDLYDQAIAEIRSNLSTEPNRADLLILLAQMYAKNGQTTEAIEVCSSLLQRFPYSLDANRLLSELLPEDEKETETRTYRQRILDIDPYYAYITHQSPTLESVPDQAVTINRLDWTGGIIGQESSEQSEWVQPDIKDISGTEIGDVDLENWLSESVEESIDDQAATRSPDQSGDEIPDWIQEAGWEPSSGDIDESDSKIEYKEDISTEEAIAGEIPSWLQSVAPDGLDSEGEGEPDVAQPISKIENSLDLLGDELDFSSPGLRKEIEPDTITGEGSAIDAIEQSESVNLDDPEWLSRLGRDPSKGQLDSQVDDIPDWLSELEDSESQQVTRTDGDKRIDAGDFTMDSAWREEIPTESPHEEVAMPNSIDFDTPDEEEIPDWIQEIDPELAEAEVEAESETSDVSKWLEGLEEEIPEPDPHLETVQTPPLETSAEKAETEDASSIPSWLRNLEDEITGSEEIALPKGEAVIGDTPESIQDVQSRSQESGTPQDVIIDEEPIDLPDWLLNSDDEFSEDLPPIQSEESSTTEKTEDDTIEIPPDDLSDMLQELSDMEPEMEEEILTEGENMSPRDAEPGEIPGWLEDLRNQESPGEEEKLEDITAHDEDIAEPAELPDWMLETEDKNPITDTEEISDQIVSTESEDILEPSDLPEWMRELRESAEVAEAKQISEETIQSEPEDVDESTDLPDWMLKTPDDATEPVGPSISDVQETELSEDSDEVKDVPEWLKDFGDEKPDKLSDEKIESVDISKPEDESLPADIPEWLYDLGEKDPTSSSESVDEIHIEEPSKPDKEDGSIDQDIDIPSWVRSTEGSEQDTFPSGVTGWLEGFDEEEVSKVEIDYSTGELPTWLENLGGIPEEGGADKLTDEFETEPVAAAIQLPESFEGKADETEEEGDAEFDDLNEAMAWLESLAAKKGVPEDELATSPEDRTGDPPDWIQELSKSPEPTPLPDDEIKTISEEEKIPEWISETTRIETAKVEDAEALFGDMSTIDDVSDEMNLDDPDTAISWLESLAEGKDLDESIEDSEREVMSGITDETLEEIEQPQPVVEEGDIFSGETVTQDYSDGIDQLTDQEHISISDEPDEIFEPEEAPQPADIPDWVLERIKADSSDVEVPLEPVIKEELPQIEFPSEDRPDKPPSPELAPKDEFETLQLEAHSEITRGDTLDAIKKYETLVKKGKRVEDVINDLNQASLSNIKDEDYVTIMQLIGDAYMKIDKIQDALDAYTKAEKLIR